MPTFMSPVKSRTEVAEWEEPRHSGPFVNVGTVPHFLPLCNTSPHFSVRRAPFSNPPWPEFRLLERNPAGGPGGRRSPGKRTEAFRTPAWVQACTQFGGL